MLFWTCYIKLNKLLLNCWSIFMHFGLSKQLYHRTTNRRAFNLKRRLVDRSSAENHPLDRSLTQRRRVLNNSQSEWRTDWLIEFLDCRTLLCCRMATGKTSTGSVGENEMSCVYVYGSGGERWGEVLNCLGRGVQIGRSLTHLESLEVLQFINWNCRSECRASLHSQSNVLAFYCRLSVCWQQQHKTGAFG